MGRAADALDWTEEGSGVGLRALTAYPTERPDSELGLRVDTPERAIEDDLEGLSMPLYETYPAIDGQEAEEGTGPLSTRGVTRLSALADWIEGEEPAGAVVALVRSFLQEIDDVGLAMVALVSAGEAFGGPELMSAIESLAIAVETWRGNLVEHVDDLAITDHRSFSGWASLPEYSSAFTLAIVRPALAEADGWAVAATVRSGADLSPLVQAVTTTVERVNTTLRTAILGPSERGESASGLESPLAAAAW